jgi:hypothetical protein
VVRAAVSQSSAVASTTQHPETPAVASRAALKTHHWQLSMASEPQLSTAHDAKSGK